MNLAPHILAHGNWISMEEFMEIALYAPDGGYYNTNIADIGFRGDFSTTATMSDLLARRLVQQWEMSCKAFNRRLPIIEIGGGVKYIGNSAFYGFQSVRKVIINDGVEEIGEKAFQKCVSLVEVEFGNTLTTIGAKAFYKCNELDNVVLPDNVKHIGDYAFYNCEGLRVLNLGHGLENIGNFAFYACTNLSSVSLPASLQEIGKQAFRNCYSLTSVVLNSDIERIQPHVFYGCNELTIYAESTSALETWDRYWNSSYRPVIWGCTLSDDKDYVVSFTKSAATVENKNTSNVIALPTREGYVCIGWNTNSAATEATYTGENIVDVADGRKLYAIWVEETN